MGEESEDPLERVYVDKDKIDRKRLADAMEGLIGVDEGTGEPGPFSGFYELGPKAQFVVLLMYRRAADGLGELEDGAAAPSTWFADYIDVSARSIQNYANELDVVEDSDDGYYLPGYSLHEAIDFINDGQGFE